MCAKNYSNKALCTHCVPIILGVIFLSKSGKFITKFRLVLTMTAVLLCLIKIVFEINSADQSV